VVTAPLDAVQDVTSPVEREAPVYTDFRQKHVTVASLRPGETLEFAFTAVIHTALAPGQFWTEYDFARQGAVTRRTTGGRRPLQRGGEAEDAARIRASDRGVERPPRLSLARLAQAGKRRGGAEGLGGGRARWRRPAGGAAHHPSRSGTTSADGTQDWRRLSAGRRPSSVARPTSSRRASRRQRKRSKRCTTTWQRTSATSASRSAPAGISRAPLPTSCARSTATARTSTRCSRASSSRSGCTPRPRS
jgi:hypothetical protein